MSLNDFEKIKLLGEGSFGKAWLVRKKDDRKKLFVMKEMAASNEKEMKEALAEARMHRLAVHPRIIKYEAVYQKEPDTVVILMEYARGGDLSANIRRQKMTGRFFDEDAVLKWLSQACEALSYLHGQGMVHRDIKAANLFLDNDGGIKLGDFGVSRVLDDNASRMSARTCQTPVGTPMYFAPEIASGKKYGQKVDIWALGCVLYEMIKLKPPFQAQSIDSLMSRIRKGVYEKQLPDEFSPALISLVHQMLSPDPDSRPNANDILDSDLLENYTTPENRSPSPPVSSIVSRRTSMLDPVAEEPLIDRDGTPLRRFRSMVYSGSREEQDSRQQAKDQLSSISFVEDTPVRPSKRRMSRFAILRRGRNRADSLNVNPTPSEKAAHHGRRRRSEPFTREVTRQLPPTHRSSEDLLKSKQPFLSDLPALVPNQPRIKIRPDSGVAKSHGSPKSKRNGLLREPPTIDRDGLLSPRLSPRPSPRPSIDNIGKGALDVPLRCRRQSNTSRRASKIEKQQLTLAQLAQKFGHNQQDS